MRRDVEELVRTRTTALVSGKAAALRAEELCAILALAQRLGLTLDVWAPQNQLWAWAARHQVPLDEATLQRLARHFWFDEATLEARAGYGAPEGEAVAK